VEESAFVFSVGYEKQILRFAQNDPIQEFFNQMLIAVSGGPLTDITELQRLKFVLKGEAVVRNDLK
jgi:hypothetical protein